MNKCKKVKEEKKELHYKIKSIRQQNNNNVKCLKKNVSIKSL